MAKARGIVVTGPAVPAQPAFLDVASFFPLLRAARKAARGKRVTAETAAFLLDLEPECLALERELLSGAYRPRRYKTSAIRDPKPRIISAAAFRDRVVHHALCAAMEPTFEAIAIDDSYACRVGKGVHRAILRVQTLAGLHPRFLKLDVRHFFESADHQILCDALAVTFTDTRLLALAQVFVGFGAPGSPRGRGLPIGNLTSQHFANYYLRPLDLFITEALGAPGYVRYLDDLFVFGPDVATLRRWRHAIDTFATQALRLELKSEAERSGPVAVGVSALGFRVWPRLIRLDAARVRRFRRSVRRVHGAASAGDPKAVARVQSLIEWTRLANATRMRRSFFARLDRDCGDE